MIPIFAIPCCAVRRVRSHFTTVDLVWWLLMLVCAFTNGTPSTRPPTVRLLNAKFAGPRSWCATVRLSLCRKENLKIATERKGCERLPGSDTLATRLRVLRDQPTGAGGGSPVSSVCKLPSFWRPLGGD
uniref:Putative secreted protein n=1 Tax=Anopheles darlingi TaxID=43151 RepID=A0A2M4DI16_ANODA